MYDAFTRFSLLFSLASFRVEMPLTINSKIVSPALTTVDQPGDKIGRTAVRFLIQELENPTNDVMTKTVEIKTSLIVRDSSLMV
ncbi:MAG: substrate-binding domain-containing protein [Maribacter sp.]|nr:substrate-binding domain-containing protein [Maribacter sp.]